MLNGTELAPPPRPGGIPLWLLNRDPAELRGQVCVGPADHCAQLLSRYADAGCGRVHLWPLGDERRQLELIAAEVAPMIDRSRP